MSVSVCRFSILQNWLIVALYAMNLCSEVTYLRDW